MRRGLLACGRSLTDFGMGLVVMTVCGGGGFGIFKREVHVVCWTIGASLIRKEESRLRLIASISGLYQWLASTLGFRIFCRPAWSKSSQVRRGYACMPDLFNDATIDPQDF